MLVAESDLFAIIAYVRKTEDNPCPSMDVSACPCVLLAVVLASTAIIGSWSPGYLDHRIGVHSWFLSAIYGSLQMICYRISDKEFTL